MNLALVAVFISILFMGGIVERLFREFSITLVAAIMISLMVSLTLTPMLCARWLRHAHERNGQRLAAHQRRGFGWLLRGYDRTLGWALRHAPLVVLPAARRDGAQRAPLHQRAQELPAATRTPASSAASSAATMACRSR